ncbi:MAG: SPASM domain-containing protein [Phascolarctobacterium sp.]|uniref:radical SAM protein n=1 Tax=Phascolarctobacterium sp. TaxID=2049039 RepID=UPI0026DAE423|nr:SPASM domain-containing protein [Phascolarctobacterium sp.]MDO4920917.1 SPASM domain-containing protein [Phascolarctobacterium sp.]
MKSFLQRRINRIYIMLGNSCNMNCAYCLQHPLVNGQLTQKINPDIYDFFGQISQETGGKRLRLIFYGGEPLLYFSAIRQIVVEAEKRGLPLGYGVISNGKAITDEIVDFFNVHDFSVTISWDGYRTKNTRGCDVFAQGELKARLLRIRHLGVSGVISSAAYPLELLETFQHLSDEYQALQGHPLAVNLDAIMDTGLTNRWLLHIDYERVSCEMRQLASAYVTNIAEEQARVGNSIKMAYMESILRQASQFYLKQRGQVRRQTAYCGNGLTVLNVDLKGNLYACHNVREKAGSIYSDFFTYLQNILAGETLMRHRQKCLACEALAFCKGGCKLVRDKTEYCKLQRALFVPALEILLQKGYELLINKEEASC